MIIANEQILHINQFFVYFESKGELCKGKYYNVRGRRRRVKVKGYEVIPKHKFRWPPANYNQGVIKLYRQYGIIPKAKIY